ncbi:Glyco_18 domain-containing protein [Meloidogyne graminicola]|uniref:Glyco_18 domain-containing protein n=1 Tax=Meloidogyne graminicola TaxID=189291 RepID=A0A8S9ZN29_9BILA|nr:Glyco_18 domain-containing protein [Meloidogyne graminicola]
MARREKLLQIFSFNLFVFLIIILFNFAETKKRPPIETNHEFRVDDITEQNARKFELDKCAFYCFFVPLQDDIQIDLHFYKYISCSDIVLLK